MSEMTTEQRQSTGSGVARATFGTVLFIAWGVLSVIWVYDAIYELTKGHFTPAITAVVAVWLSARQMFVASICVAATILAARSAIHIPFTSHTITGSQGKIFNLVWT